MTAVSQSAYESHGLRIRTRRACIIEPYFNESVRAAYEGRDCLALLGCENTRIEPLFTTQQRAKAFQAVQDVGNGGSLEDGNSCTLFR